MHCVTCFLSFEHDRPGDLPRHHVPSTRGPSLTTGSPDTGVTDRHEFELEVTFGHSALHLVRPWRSSCDRATREGTGRELAKSLDSVSRSLAVLVWAALLVCHREAQAHVTDVQIIAKPSRPLL